MNNLGVCSTYSQWIFLVGREGGAHQKWYKVNEKAKCIILRSLDEVLQHEYMSLATTYGILSSL